MTTQEKVWKIGGVVGILLAVFLLVMSIKEFKSIGYVGRSDQMVNIISVNGTGEAVAIPDIATFSFTVSETAKTVAEAQEKATAKINSALDAVKKEGVAENDIKTLSYNINPKYEYQGVPCTIYSCPPSRSILTGYEVSQTTEVKIRDLSKAGALFTTIGSAGVQNVNGLNFTIDNIEEVKAMARAEAIADARTKAGTIAKQLGVRLVRITSYYDSSDQPGPYYYGRGGDTAVSVAEKAVPPQVPTGEQEIVSNVTVSYEIK